LAYDRDTFVGGSSVLCLSIFEVQIWHWYHTYICRNKIDRIETPLAFAGIGSACDKFKGLNKLTHVMATKSEPNGTASELIQRLNSIKKKKENSNG